MSLRKTTIKGIAWNSAGSIGSGVFNILITVVLARILTPYDFGIIELLIVFSVLSDALVDSGFSQALIRDDKATKKDLSSVFYLNIIIAIIIYIVLFFFSPLIANFYNEPSLKNLSRFVFITVIINSFSIIQNVNFSKNIDFKPQAISSISAMIIAGILSIVMAYQGYGVWALAVNLVLFSLLKTSFIWVQSKWLPIGWICFESIKKYLMFSSHLLLLGLIDKLVTNLEALLIGKIYTKNELGFFAQGRKINSYITQTSTSVIQRVTYPVLSKFENNITNLKNGYRKVIGVTMTVMTPIMIFIIASSENIILVVFGERWLAATPFLEIWALIGLFVSLYSFFINIFLVLGRSKQLLVISLIRQLIRLITVIILIRISIMTLMWGILIVTLITTIIFAYYGGKLINYSIASLIADLWQIFFASLVGGLAIYSLNYILSDINKLVIIILDILLMFFVYFSILWGLKNEYFKELKEFATLLKPKKC